ncbi:hypothetical protein ACFQGT_15685 [Natrialbaceae archaeon GCM10025810]|uniref:hypothetical protein n=1 Tax=Halovalidus salilacus TaxID=3075124 RepID=UPI0036123EDF
MVGDDRDPSTIRSLAVSAGDVVDAYAYNRENPGTAVLRVTPPFHGRMRARLHVYRVDDSRMTGAIHVDPDDLLDDEVTRAYPTLETALDDASIDAEETERLRQRHSAAVGEWRDRAREAIVDTVPLEVTHRGPAGSEPEGVSSEVTAGGTAADEPHVVEVKRLG